MLVGGWGQGGWIGGMHGAFVGSWLFLYQRYFTPLPWQNMFIISRLHRSDALVTELRKTRGELGHILGS